MRLTGMVTADRGESLSTGCSMCRGASMFEMRLYLQRHKDDLRKCMLHDPRGYPGLCCNLILPPTVPEADAGFVIMEQAD